MRLAKIVTMLLQQIYWTGTCVPTLNNFRHMDMCDPNLCLTFCDKYAKPNFPDMKVRSKYLVIVYHHNMCWRLWPVDREVEDMVPASAGHLTGGPHVVELVHAQQSATVLLHGHCLTGISGYKR